MAKDVNYWLREIKLYEREFKSWETRAKEILKRYRDDRSDAVTGTNGARHNILWSNVQTLVPAVYARLPRPEVTRRFGDKDQIGRVAGLILERAIAYEIDHYTDYGSSMRECVEDRFLCGRAVAWVRYEPHLKDAPEGSVEEDGSQISEDKDDGEERPQVIEYECSPVDYVNWDDFGHTVARTWEEVTAVWRRVYMSRDELQERFGDVSKEVPLDAKSIGLEDRLADNEADSQSQATIYEIWDRDTNNVYWLSKSYGEFLDTKPDPLGLEQFFPCPRPIYATTTNNSLVPVPDFVLYQDQAAELDLISQRIEKLIQAVKVTGVYDSAARGVQNMLTESGDNTLIPVENWALFAEKGGIKGAVDFMPLEMVVNALNVLYQARDQIKSQIYEITGISDILRGVTQASETATAQEIKGRFASIRIKQTQDEVVRFATDLLRLKAEIICKHFQPKTILNFSGAEQLPEAQVPEGQQLIMQAIQAIKGNPLRQFRIEISSDSMMYMDEQEEKQSRLEFLTTVSQFMQQSALMAQAAPQYVPVLGEMLLFGIRGFKAGRSIEGVFEQAIEQTKQAAAQPKQQAPDPKMAEVQGKLQLQGQRQQFEQEMAQQEQAVTHQREMEKIASQERIAALNAQTDIEKHRMTIEAENARYASGIVADHQSKIGVANIGAAQKHASEVMNLNNLPE